jgi:hypothetical protein
MLIGPAAPLDSRADDANPAAPATSPVPDQPAIRPFADKAESASKPTQSAADTANLVTKLGDDVFAVRENASNRLVQKGIAAKPQLLAALDSPDAEVRFRAKHILAEVVEVDFQKRLSAFSADVDGKLDLSMPGWTAYKQMVGSDRTARDLFVEMQQAEGPLLEAYEQGPKQAAEKLRAQIAAEPNVVNRAAAIAAMRVRRMLPTLPQNSTSSLGSILAWLFVAGDDAVPLSDDITGRVVMLPQNVVFQEAAQPNIKQADPRGEVCRKILGRWVAREINPVFAGFNFSHAYQFNLKEGLGPAVAVLKTTGQAASSDARLQAMAMFIVSRFGNKEHIALLEPFLDDPRVCFDSGGPNQPVKTEIRDIALLNTIKLAGQDPKQFGFDRWQDNDQLTLNLNPIGFRGDEERDAAFKKWEAWQTGQKSATGEEAGTKAAGEKSG